MDDFHVPEFRKHGNELMSGPNSAQLTGGNGAWSNRQCHPSKNNSDRARSHDSERQFTRGIKA